MRDDQSRTLRLASEVLENSAITIEDLRAETGRILSNQMEPLDAATLLDLSTETLTIALRLVLLGRDLTREASETIKERTK